jgi:2-polyprenyl-3-methyl-5-hydroxy-6-metoxy-1,4-benzoquinol methylase
MCGFGASESHIDFSEIPVVRCCGCRFLYAARLMPAQALSDYYADTFGSMRHLRGQIVNAKINAWAFGRLLGPHARLKVMDVGTGYGYFLQQLERRYGIRATGVEVSRREAAHGRERLGQDITAGYLADGGFTPGSYDVVTSFEVIEHVPAPAEFLAEMASYLRVGGRLLVMTDNFESRVVQSLGAGFPKWIPHAHVSHFSPESLSDAVRAAGLKIVGRLSYTPWELELKDAYYRWRGIRKSPAEAYDLAQVMATEMGGTFRLFHLRSLVNEAWARSTARETLDGELMYVCAEKGA